jgi:beta-lactamase regulating signal transducer with metallopeptidase domain
MQMFSENSFWLLLLKASWEASVLIVVVLAMQWLLRDRLTPRWRLRLWLLVALRLALPWTVPSPISPFNLLRFSTVSATTHNLKVVPPVPDSAETRLAQPTPSEPSSQSAVASSDAGPPRFRLPHAWLPLVWAAGASAVLLGLGVNHLRFHRKVAANRPLIDETALNLLEDCKSRMGIRTPVTLVETAAVAGPALFGFLRPRILLPPGFTRSFSHDELRFAFLHELGHVKRHDILFGWLMALLQVLHWFNPLVWLAFARMRADRELACDAVALSYTDDHEHKPYGLTIVKLLEHLGDSLRAPSLAGIVEDKQQMKERITMIAKFHKTDRGLGLAVCLFAGLALVTLTDAQNLGGPAKSDTKGSRAASLESQKPLEVGQAQTPRGDDGWDLDQKLKMAETGNGWAAYDLWDAYYRGHHGIQRDSAKADKWLGELVQNVWVVRFEPINDFAPTNPGEFLSRINRYCPYRSGRTNIGAASFFRTTKQGDKLVGSFLSNYPDQLKTGLAKVPGLKVVSVERITPEKFVSYEQSRQESLTDATASDKSPASSAEAVSAAPKIIATSPAVGASDVDPGLTEITVTFDQDMGGGMSWTGGGPQFPPTREGQKAQWRNKRTCALPVKLEAARYYRVGINSTSYRNFANQRGVAALPSAIFFTTQGASEQLKARTLLPKVVRCDPDNGAKNVSPAVTELRVTFNVPMGGGCSWCTAGDDDSDFPKGPEGKRSYWTEDKKTCVLPVALKPHMTYRISLNAPGYINFQSAGGVPMEPVAYTFKTTHNP